jgi:hypothetical protein
MGQDVSSQAFSREDRQRYREKVRACLDTFERMLREAHFDNAHSTVGLELELDLVDENYDPAMRSSEALAAITDPAFQTELGQFNIEINVPPRSLAESGLSGFEAEMRTSLNRADARARSVDARLMMIGILPTLTTAHTGLDCIAPNPRYRLLNEAIFAARGEDLHIAIVGDELLDIFSPTILPEAACTSTQFHLQLSPADFPRYWNAAQCLAAVQVAVGANSPYFFGRRLWRETRIALFEQATDTRPEELKAQGVRPRVWFGERWITSVFDLYEENSRYFPALLPVLYDEDPTIAFDRGHVPTLGELTLHNGTIWRWNRPVYAVVDGTPHLRIENRVLPAGPTVADVIANAAFYYGALRALASEHRPVWTQLAFSTALENFRSAARSGIDAVVYWPGLGEVPVTELVLRRLLPAAAAGLEAWGTSPTDRDRFLGIIEARCLAYRNGASWQVDTMEALTSGGGHRLDHLREMARRYAELMHTNQPVHSWPVG